MSSGPAWGYSWGRGTLPGPPPGASAWDLPGLALPALPGGTAGGSCRASVEVPRSWGRREGVAAPPLLSQPSQEGQWFNQASPGLRFIPGPLKRVASSD